MKFFSLTMNKAEDTVPNSEAVKLLANATGYNAKWLKSHMIKLAQPIYVHPRQIAWAELPTGVRHLFNVNVVVIPSLTITFLPNRAINYRLMARLLHVKQSWLMKRDKSFIIPRDYHPVGEPLNWQLEQVCGVKVA